MSQLTLVGNVLQSMQRRDSLSNQVFANGSILRLLAIDESDHHEGSWTDKPLAVLRIAAVVILELDDRRRVDGLSVLGVVFLDDLGLLRLLSDDELGLLSRHHVVRSSDRLSTQTDAYVDLRCCCRIQRYQKPTVTGWDYPLVLGLGMRRECLRWMVDSQWSIQQVS